jgi:hypothetical protein
MRIKNNIVSLPPSGSSVLEWFRSQLAYGSWAIQNLAALCHTAWLEHDPLPPRTAVVPQDDKSLTWDALLVKTERGNPRN